MKKHINGGYKPSKKSGNKSGKIIISSPSGNSDDNLKQPYDLTKSDLNKLFLEGEKVNITLLGIDSYYDLKDGTKNQFPDDVIILNIEGSLKFKGIFYLNIYQEYANYFKHLLKNNVTNLDIKKSKDPRFGKSSVTYYSFQVKAISDDYCIRYFEEGQYCA